jgi:hypothetical protein
MVPQPVPAVSVQLMLQSTPEAVNSRTAAVLNGWKTPASEMGLKGGNPKGSSAIWRDFAKRRKRLL